MVSYEFFRGRLPAETLLAGVTPQSSAVTTALAIYDQRGLSELWSGAFSNSIRHATINVRYLTVPASASHTDHAV
jgi:hypothetical protein